MVGAPNIVHLWHCNDSIKEFENIFWFFFKLYSDEKAFMDDFWQKFEMIFIAVMVKKWMKAE